MLKALNEARWQEANQVRKPSCSVSIMLRPLSLDRDAILCHVDAACDAISLDC